MIYFANPSTDLIRDTMSAGQLACILTPAQRLKAPPGAVWCADNGRFGKGWPGPDKWWAWLEGLPNRDLCAFAVAPDVVGDAATTLSDSAPWLPKIRSLGIPAALVAQDGLEHLPVPWDTFDVLFIGGSTEWKLSPAAADLSREAVRRDKRVHMGRVNSARRMRHAVAIGCTSADGTVLLFGPDVNLHRPLSWVREARELATAPQTEQLPLF